MRGRRWGKPRPGRRLPTKPPRPLPIPAKSAGAACYPRCVMTAAATTYPSYAELQARRLAEHRARAVAAARAAAVAGAEYGVRVTIFGSLAEGRFHRDSDLDLALDGPEEVIEDAAAAAWEAAGAAGFEPDLLRLARIKPHRRARLLAHACDPSALG